MIPKIIHYVWVGDSAKPQSVLNCIESWKKHCPDYAIMEWDNQSIKSISNLYVTQAFENKKWAFVSDYLRLFALYNYGGFYFDTDLELTNSIEGFRICDYVMGFEKYNESFNPQTAFLGCTKNNEIVAGFLKEYEDISFVVDGKMDLTTNVARISKYLKEKFDLKDEWDGNSTLVITDKSFVFPYYFFCEQVKGCENYAIHHFDGTWIDGWSRKIICTIAGYRVIRFRKRNNIMREDFSLLHDEELISSFNFNFLNMRIKICLTKIK